MARVLGLRWTPCDAIAEQKARAMAKTLGRREVWTTLIDRRGVLLMRHAPVEGSSPCLVFPNEMGAVFGPLFARDRGGPVEAISEAETDRLVNGGGCALVEDFWGCYFAVLHDRGRDLLHIVRDRQALALSSSPNAALSPASSRTPAILSPSTPTCAVTNACCPRSSSSQGL